MTDYDAIALSYGWFKLRRGWYHPFAELYVGYVGFPVCYRTSQELCEMENLTAPMPREELLKEGARLSNWLATYSHDLMEDGNCDQEAAELNRAAQWIADHLSIAQTSGWQPIETALRDGARIILAWDNIPSLPYHWEVGFFRSNSHRSPAENYGGWCNTYGHAFSGEPTHWMLPAPPSNQGASK